MTCMTKDTLLSVLQARHAHERELSIEYEDACRLDNFYKPLMEEVFGVKKGEKLTVAGVDYIVNDIFLNFSNDGVCLVLQWEDRDSFRSERTCHHLA